MQMRKLSPLSRLLPKGWWGGEGHTESRRQEERLRGGIKPNASPRSTKAINYEHLVSCVSGFVLPRHLLPAVSCQLAGARQEDGVKTIPAPTWIILHLLNNNPAGCVAAA